MNVLIVGGTGQLGRCLQDRAPTDWQVLAPSSSSLDISDHQQVADYLATHQVDVVINASSYNAVDQAESDAVRAYAVNAQGPENLARRARLAGAKFFHVSTDYVFSGDQQRPYTEADAPSPISVYGQSKRAGEMAVLAANPEAIVIRTAWLYSEYGRNFVKTMLALAAEDRLLTVVNDQIGTPTYAGDLAEVIIGLVARTQVPGGLYHYAGRDALSWFEFAQAILRNVPHRLQPITSEDYPTVARRPRYSALACRKLQAMGFAPRPQADALEHVRRAVASVRR